MTINKAKVGITGKGSTTGKQIGPDDLGKRAVWKPNAQSAKSRPGTRGQKPDEPGPETWPGGVDRFHENL